MVRWESKQWEAKNGGRMVHAEFGLYSSHPRGTEYSWCWEATRYDKGTRVGTHVYPNIAMLKLLESRWLEGEEV